MTFEIGVAEKESSANLPFVEIGRRGNVRADGDFNKRRIYDLSELFVPYKFGKKSGAETRILRISTGYYAMSEGLGKYERRRGKRRHAAQL